MRVAELMNAEGDGWDLSKINTLFLPFERDHVLRIRISDSKPGDAWCWEREKDGNYTVKSAYKVLVGESGKNEAATKKNIAARMELTDDTCPRCLNCVETCLHVVRDCGWVEGIWEELGVDVLPEAGLKRERWNKVIFEMGEWREDEVINRTKDLIWEMQNVVSEDTSGGTRESESGDGRGWVRPAAGLVKINVDAGVVDGVGLREAKIASITKVEVESDCRVVIHDLKK
ncbi:hypothetical protein RND81_10G051500 [Saponaria officinalis]|uniref:Reverse transcriptase zinc-binding domain-containing protein n=1 Tax=Saponaria officinalis TaxID=3572 RepID=A0AAW1I0Z9_SAPOF